MEIEIEIKELVELEDDNRIYKLVEWNDSLSDFLKDKTITKIEKLLGYVFFDVNNEEKEFLIQCSTETESNSDKEIDEFVNEIIGRHCINKLMQVK